MSGNLRNQISDLIQLKGGVLTVPLTIEGTGIQKIIFNPDYSMTIVLTDGSSYTSPPLIGPGLPAGGTKGQMIIKSSSEDYDTEWTNQTYVHTQSQVSDVWTIQHNLGKYPSVSIVDTAGSVVVGDVRYIDDDNLTVTFNGAFSGVAYLN